MSVGDRDWNSISSVEYVIFLMLAAVFAFLAIGSGVLWLLVVPALIIVLCTIGRIATVNAERKAEGDD